LNVQRLGGPLAAAAAGAIAVAGFGDLPLLPLPILALAALCALWLRTPTPRRAAFVGFAFGAGFFLTGVSWVYVSLHDFGMMPAPLAGLATVLFCLYLALFPAATGYLQARFRAGPATRVLLVVPALWAVTEWLRGWLLTGFPWLNVGYSQVDGPLAGLLPLVGVYGVSFATLVIAGAVALTITRVRAAILHGAIAVAVVVIAAIAGGQAVFTQPVGSPVTVALLQGNVPQELKFVPGRFEATLQTYTALADRTQAKLIVFPETAIPRFLHQVDPAYLERLAAIARRNGGDALVGVPMRRDEGYYNAVLTLGTSPQQGYAKSHLVPFGEFVPPGFGWIVNVLQIPLSDFARGAADAKPLAIAGERVAPNICYEDAFGEEIIRQLPEATLLANVSNVAWFGDSLAPAQHLRISRARSIETGRYMLRATNTGVTAIIDDRGRVAARLPMFTEGVLEGTAQGRTGATPYVVLGNRGMLGMVVLALLAAVLIDHRRRLRGRGNANIRSGV
jgi:apolipoprotein N-acyltransferase